MSTYVLRKKVARLADLVDGNAAFMQIAGAGGNVYFVDAAGGSDGNDGSTPGKAKKTILAAYNACTDGANDIVALIGNATSHTLSAALVWAKSYTHLIGLCAPTMTGKRARIFQLSTLTGASPLLTISGNGCVFSNFYIFQGVNDATSLINVSVTGGRNYFEGVHFAGGGHTAQAIDGGASLYLNGAEECTFQSCVIGVDTVAAAAGMDGLLVGGGAKRCTFNACNFTMYAGAATAAFVEFADASAFDRYLIFRDCMFINDASAQAMTSGFIIPAGMGSLTHRLVMHNSFSLGATDWDASNRGLMYLSGGTITGGGNAGLYVVSNAT